MRMTGSAGSRNLLTGVAWVATVAILVTLPTSLLHLPEATLAPSHLTKTRNGTIAGMVEPSELTSSPAPGPWPTYLYNVERTAANTEERTIASSNVSDLREVWTLATNASDFSAPIVVNQTVYFGSWNGYEYAVNASDGEVEWSQYLGIDNCSSSSLGVSSTPAFVDGTIYLGGGDGYWYALNASTGAVDWRFFVGSPTINGMNDYDWASTLVYQNSLYIGVASCFDNPLIRGALVQVNLTGPPTANHTFYTISNGEIGNSIWTTPAVDPETNTIWVSTGNEGPDEGYPMYANAIIALNATTLNVTGSWQVPNEVGNDSDFGSTPTLAQTAAGLPIVVATDKDGIAYAFNRTNVSSNGSWGPIWELDTGGGLSSGAFDGQTLYLAGDGVYAVDPSNGSVLWRDTGFPGVIGALSWANGVVYVGLGGDIYALDAHSGQILWSQTVPGGGGIDAESVVANGRLYVPSGDFGTEGELTAYGLPLAGNGTAIPENGTVPLEVAFRANPQGGMPPYSFDWAFGDGTLGTGVSPAHVYSEPGNYTTTLWINDSAGESIEQNLTVDLPTPTDPGLAARITASLTAGAAPLTVNFTALETNGTLPPYTFAWNYGDGANGSGTSVAHTYSSPGDYNVSLQVVDRFGNTANCTLVVNVHPPTLYLVSFNEHALPAGTVWSVNVGSGASFSGNSSVISFRELNGSYSYQISTQDGNYSAESGFFVVSGAPVDLAVGFSLVTYPVSVTESGLPDGDVWSFDLTGGPVYDSSNHTLAFFEPNGTVPYSARSSNLSYFAHGGMLTVTGDSVAILVRFALVTYTVTVTETGLPQGDQWWLNLSGSQTFSSTARAMTFYEPNGSYSPTVSTPNKSYSGSAASFEVVGADASFQVSFSLVVYSVSFDESGLPAATVWGVAITGGPGQSAPGHSLDFHLTNGTYSYSVFVLYSTYAPNATNGTIEVHGANLEVKIAFLPPPTPLAPLKGGGGVPPISGAALVILSLGVVTGVTFATLAVLRRPKSPVRRG